MTKRGVDRADSCAVASAVVADVTTPRPCVPGGYLYRVQASGETHVFKAGATLEPIALKRTTDEDEETFGAPPALSSGCLSLRSNRNLSCTGDGAQQEEH